MGRLLTLNRCASVPLGISSLAQWIYNSIRKDPPTALESVEDLRQRHGSGFNADSHWPALVPGPALLYHLSAAMTADDVKPSPHMESSVCLCSRPYGDYIEDTHSSEHIHAHTHT
ncbi:unnamed protein product [Leuciscus chuanchicus]